MKLNSYVEGIQKEASNRFSNYNGNAIGKLDAFDRTLTFVITPSTTTAVAKAILFGQAYDPTDSLQTNCTVTVKESSHQEVKAATINSFRIQGIRYFVTSSAQFANPFSIIHRSAFGTSETKVWQPSSSESPDNFNDKIILDMTFQMLITQQDRIEIDLNAGETVRIIFYVVDKINPEQQLNGMSSIATTSAGVPTGKTAQPMVLMPTEALQAQPRGITGGYGNFSLADELYRNASGDVFSNRNQRY